MNEISVIVPVYNTKKFLSKCLESILQQSIIDIIKIIIINDGSTDDSENVILKFCKEYPERIEYYKKENGGLSSARNLGLQKCKTKYISFIDSDDYIDEYMFEKLYNAIKENDNDISICGLEKCDVKGKRIEYEQIDFNGEFNKNEVLELMLQGRVPCYAWNKLYKSELFKNNNIEFPIGRYYEDIVTFYKLINASKKIRIIDEPLYYYVQHGNSICYTPTIKKANDILDNLDDIVGDHNRNKWINLFIANNVIASAILYYRCIYSKQYIVANEGLIDKYRKKLKKYTQSVKLRALVFNRQINNRNKLIFIMYYLNIINIFYYFKIKRMEK